MVYIVIGFMGAFVLFKFLSYRRNEKGGISFKDADNILMLLINNQENEYGTEKTNSI
jgi:hypothetical protein